MVNFENSYRFAKHWTPLVRHGAGLLGGAATSILGGTANRMRGSRGRRVRTGHRLARARKSRARVSFKFKGKFRGPGSSVIGQYQQRSGKRYGGGRGRRQGRLAKSVKSTLFKMLPTMSYLTTNVSIGQAGARGTEIVVNPQHKQAYASIGMYGCQGLPSLANSSGGIGPTEFQDGDLNSILAIEFEKDQPNLPANADAIAYNNWNAYILNAHLSVDFVYQPSAGGGQDITPGPCEVTFYTIVPRKSQRVGDKDDIIANTWLQKYYDYFLEDNHAVGNANVEPRFLPPNATNDYDSTPFDSRVFCTQWKVVAEKKMIVNPGQTCSFSWGRRQTRRIRGADMDEYDFIKGVYTQILVKFKRIDSNVNAGIGDWHYGFLKYKKTYNYKVIKNNYSGSTSTDLQVLPTM